MTFQGYMSTATVFTSLARVSVLSFARCCKNLRDTKSEFISNISIGKFPFLFFYMVHSPEEQLLSLSPAPSSRRSSNHVTQESFANLYDDGSDRQESQAGPSSIVRTPDIR